MPTPTPVLASLLSLLLCGAAAAAESVPAPEALREDTTGFLPLWEGTGHVERAGDLRVSSTGAQIGVGGIAHVGVLPLNLMYRTPNAFAKLSLLRTERWAVAAGVGALYLLEGASRASFSPVYSTRLDNPDFGITLVPVSGSASFLATPWLALHQTLTALGLFTRGPLKNTLSLGYSAVVELNPGGRHAVSFHAGEVGFWAHDLATVGASYRYRNTWLELRLGWFYRFSPVGAQASPLVGIGVLL